MKQLRIDKPCNENWDEFTPKPDGGFCRSCDKIVVDFTNKSNQEISDILRAKSNENICGRIGVGQLENFNDSFINWQTNTTNRGIQSRFLWALVLSFGLTLFTSINASAQHILGEMTYVELKTDSTAAIADSTNKPQPQAIENIEEMIMGDIEVVMPIKDTIPKDTISSHVVIEHCQKPKLNPTINIPKVDETFIMGKMIVPQPTEIKRTRELKLPQPVSSEKTIGRVFPNPINNETTLYLDIEQSEFYSITVFDQNGNLCQQALKKILTKGKHSIDISLNEFESGLYHISITSKSHQSTIQLVKN